MLDILDGRIGRKASQEVVDDLEAELSRLDEEEQQALADLAHLDEASAGEMHAVRPNVSVALHLSFAAENLPCRIAASSEPNALCRLR